MPCAPCAAKMKAGFAPDPCCRVGLIAASIPEEDLDLFQAGIAQEEKPWMYEDAVHVDELPYMVGALLGNHMQGIDLDVLAKNLRTPIPFQTDELPMVGGFEPVKMPTGRLFSRSTPIGLGEAGAYKVPYGFDSDEMVGATLPRQAFHTGSKRVWGQASGKYELPYEFDNDEMVGTIGGGSILPRHLFMKGSKRIQPAGDSYLTPYEFDADEMIGAVATAVSAPFRFPARRARMELKSWAKTGGYQVAADPETTRAHAAKARIYVYDWNQYRILYKAATMIQNAVGAKANRTLRLVFDDVVPKTFKAGFYDFEFYVPEEEAAFRDAQEGVSGFAYPGVGALPDEAASGKLVKLAKRLATWASENRIRVKGANQKGRNANILRAQGTNPITGEQRHGAGVEVFASSEADRVRLAMQGQKMAPKGTFFKLTPTASDAGKGRIYAAYFTDDPGTEIVGVLYLPAGNQDARALLCGALADSLHRSPSEKAYRIQAKMEHLNSLVQALAERLASLQQEAQNLVQISTAAGEDLETRADAGVAGFAYPGVGGFAYPGVEAVGATRILRVRRSSGARTRALTTARTTGSSTSTTSTQQPRVIYAQAPQQAQTQPQVVYVQAPATDPAVMIQEAVDPGALLAASAMPGSYTVLAAGTELANLAGLPGFGS